VACLRCPYAIGVAPDGTVWVSSLGPSNGTSGRGGIDVFDPALPTPDGTGGFDPVRKIALRGRPVFASFWRRPDGYQVLVPEQAGPDDAVHIYGSGGRGVEPLRLDGIALQPDRCLNAHMLLVAADGRRAQLICEGDHRGPGSFLWMDLEQRSVLGSTPIGVFPDGLAIIPKAAAAP